MKSLDLRNIKLKKTAIILCLVSFFFALILNEINLYSVRKESHITNSELLRYNETISSPDDNDYIKPPQNFLEGKDWTLGGHMAGPAGSFWRTPSYII